MTARTGSCPNCGAAITFLWSSAVQTTCDYCRAILVRHDVDLEKVGVVGDLPLDASPIQRGTEGRWQGETFVVVGRIIYEYERGAWNEWHLRFSDGTSGWLSDAQLEYTVSRLVTSDYELPGASQVEVGAIVLQGHTRWVVTTITQAHYRGVEGELPFEYWDKSDVSFADLETEGDGFATIDYSETPALLFVGENVGFADLSLRDVRVFDGWPAP